MNRLIVLLLVFLGSLHMEAPARPYQRREETLRYDSVKVSLLTCGAGNQIYSLFGHTAIRVRCDEMHWDWVYNYGMFDYRTPNFATRFVLGKTDYELGVINFNDFLYPYITGNRWVYEQRLHLEPAEKRRLLQALNVNYLPQNRVYRYNFFYDNCATRPLNKIEQALIGQTVYSDSVQQEFSTRTYRDIVYECSEGYLWTRFGMNFCLGLPADLPIGHREVMFAPLYLRDAFSTAQVERNDGTIDNLVEWEGIVLPSRISTVVEKSWLDVFTPMVTFSLLFLVVAALSVWQWMSRSSLWWLDMLLFSAAGVCGCVIAFLTFFSEHPAVSPNFLLIVFHPIHLFVVPFLLKTLKKRRKPVYYLINLVILTLFILLFGVIPQRFDLAVVPLALSLLLRSLMNVLCYYKYRYKYIK